MTSEQRRAAHFVYLGSKSYEVTVSEEGYRQIIELVQAHSVCRRCKSPYTLENPNVAGNFCLSCFLREDRNSLTFQGKLDPAILPDRHTSEYAPYTRPTYLFLDSEGHVHTTEAGPGASERAEESMRATARYWHFQVPEQAERNGEAIRITGFSLTIYGDVRTSEVVLLCYTEYHPEIEILFLARRDGPAIQVNRRKGRDRYLFESVREELEVTLMPDEKYYARDPRSRRYQLRVRDSDVYRRVAERLEQRRKDWLEEKKEKQAEQEGGQVIEGE